METQPLTMFHPFSRLPIELRLKIYGIAAHFPRIIELERGLHTLVPENWSYQVCRRSHRPPATLEVCHEARAECLNFYEKRVFESVFVWRPDHQYGYVWYNPRVDVVLTGNIKLPALGKLFSSGREIPRIGFVLATCSIATTSIIFSFCGHKKKNLPPCPGLREIVIVVPSQIYHVEAGKVDANVGLRAAIGRGRNAREKGEEGLMTLVVERTKNHGVATDTFPSPHFKQMTEVPIPDIRFVSLTTIARNNDPNVLDGMTIPDETISELERYLTQKFYADFKEKFGCELIIGEMIEGLGKQKIGFFGPRSAVEKAKSGARGYFNLELGAHGMIQKQAIDVHGVAFTRVLFSEGVQS